MTTKRILLTGASGYLGQHLLSHWMTQGEVGQKEDTTGIIQYEITALYNRLEGFPEAVQKAKSTPGITVRVVSLDLSSSSLVEDANKQMLDFSSFDVCVHTAALSSPRACEADPEKARAINVPTTLLNHLSDYNVPIVVLSTDQVYDGKKDVVKDGPYIENDDIPNPLNVYGKTKLELEEHIQKYSTTNKKATDAIILRSSIILGPKAPFGKAHDTFFHFCQSRDQMETTFFVNEYRTVVGVGHVCRVVTYFVNRQLLSSKNNNNNNLSPDAAAAAASCKLYHLGGPNRVNRLDMAKAVFAHFGYDEKFALEAQQTSSMSPLDISMDSTKLEKVTGIIHEPKTLQELVQETFPEEEQNKA